MGRDDRSVPGEADISVLLLAEDLSVTPDRCSHGVTWDDECKECEIIGITDTLERWEPRVAALKTKPEELQNDANPTTHTVYDRR